jgi:hypothetical protein
MFSSAGANPLALHTDNQKSHRTPLCLENPRPAGADSTLTENVASPFQAEPPHQKALVWEDYVDATLTNLLAFSRTLIALNTVPEAGESMNWRQ